MKRFAYVNVVYETGLGYQLELTRSGRVYFRTNGHLVRADALVGRNGIAISGADEQRMTIRPDLTLVIHGDPDREVRPVGEKQKEESKA